jgi:hypothetical protein
MDVSVVQAALAYIFDQHYQESAYSRHRCLHYGGKVRKKGKHRRERNKERGYVISQKRSVG